MKANLHNLEHYYHKAKADDALMKCFIDVLEDALCGLEEEEKLMVMAEIHEAVCGPHFDECLAKKAVAKMRNVDGTAGEHWTMEQTDAIAGQYGIHHKCDWYYVMNMLYSDFAKVLGSDANTYAKMAVAYINDPDAGEGKAFKLYLAGE